MKKYCIIFFSGEYAVFFCEELMETGKQKITITDRKRIEADGVKNVVSFDEGYLELETELGLLCISGEGMRVEGLNNETGKVLITGNFHELGYKEKRSKKRLFAQ